MRDATITVRALLVGYELARGAELTSRQWGERLGIQPGSAWRILARAGAVLPLYLDESDHRWKLLREDEP